MRRLSRFAVVVVAVAAGFGTFAGIASASDSVRITSDGSDSVRITSDETGSVRITEREW